MPTCNLLDLETLGFPPIMVSISPDIVVVAFNIGGEEAHELHINSLLSTVPP